MPLREIVTYPFPILKDTAKPVTDFGEELKKLVADMAETMYAAPGVGLAATQVDVHEQIIVLDISETRNQLRVFINPEILNRSGEQEGEEGCLSVPGIYENVRRSDKISVRALNQQGEPFTLNAEGFLAVCIQHEVDHLQGRVFVEYLSQLKQSRLRAKLKKRRREAM